MDQAMVQWGNAYAWQKADQGFLALEVEEGAEAMIFQPMATTRRSEGVLASTG